MFLTGYVDVGATVKAGDFPIKPAKSDELLRAIERALARHSTGLQVKREFDALGGRLATLTRANCRYFVLTVRGKTKKQTAHELGATERTIKAHHRRVMEKMKAGSLAELVSIGERLRVSTHDDYYSRCNSMEILNPLLAGKRLA